MKNSTKAILVASTTMYTLSSLASVVVPQEKVRLSRELTNEWYTRPTGKGTRAYDARLSEQRRAILKSIREDRSTIRKMAHRRTDTNPREIAYQSHRLIEKILDNKKKYVSAGA